MSTKTAYQGDANGFYIGETLADESPLEPGVWLIPGGALEAAPPLTWPDDKWPRIKGKKWALAYLPKAPEPESPVAKLLAFLAAHADVAEVLKQGGV